MQGERLRIGIALSGRQAAFWRGPLAQALRADGRCVGFLPGAVDPEPSGLALLACLERLVYRERSEPAPESPACEKQDFDLVITGGGADESSLAATPRLRLTCDGEPCAIGAAKALLDMRSPTLEAWLEQPGQGASLLAAQGRAALEDPHQYFRSHASVANRLAGLARSAVRHLAEGDLEASASPSPGVASRSFPPPGRALPFAARSLADRVARRLTRLARGEARWRVAWRMTSGDEVARRAEWPPFAFRDLPDDGRRYYADPFVFEDQGRVFVFCEEFPYAAGRAILSVFEIRDGRAVGAPRPVLEQSYHLSYPMVFARDGAIWMIPETGAAGRIELWRAARFPDKWVRAATLVDGVVASDPTLLEKDGRLWLFATISEPGGSSWDCLHLWSAERLEGPWTPHPANPVVIDAACARPAGMPFRRNGRWIRPTQDCSQIYGGGINLCAIDRLDSRTFSQSLIGRLGPPPGSFGGAHTLNAAGRVEAIDIFGPRPHPAAAQATPGGDASKPRPPAEAAAERSEP